MNLKDAIINIQYDSSWGIWAEFPFTPESKARYGRRQFKNGGLLDGFVYFDDGVNICNHISNWVGDEDQYDTDEDLIWAEEEAAEDLIQTVAEYFKKWGIN